MFTCNPIELSDSQLARFVLAGGRAFELVNEFAGAGTDTGTTRDLFDGDGHTLADSAAALASLAVPPALSDRPRARHSRRCGLPLDGLLACAHELLRRRELAKLLRTHVLNSPRAVRDYLALHFRERDHESFVVVFVDAQNRVIAVEELFRGTLSQTSVYPREVVKRALAHNAAAVILAHNHPSGVAEPSRADEFLTQRLKSALGLVGVVVLDHLVLAGNASASFAERGLL